MPQTVSEALDEILSKAVFAALAAMKNNREGASQDLMWAASNIAFADQVQALKERICGTAPKGKPEPTKIPSDGTPRCP